MSQRTQVHLNQIDTAYMMGISVASFNRWNLPPLSKTPGGDSLYDLKTVIAFRLNRDKDNESKDSTLSAERTKLTKAKRRRAELEIATMEGQFIPIDILAETWGNMIANARARILSIPSKVAALLVAENSPKKNEKILKSELTEALLELVEYDPAKEAGRKRPKTKVR